MTAENTKYTCPDCGGAIERIKEGHLVQYRCRVGHLYSPEAALAIHADREENTLWTAVAILQEGADLAEEASHFPPNERSSVLRETAAAKRELAEQVQRIVMELARKSLE